VCTVVLRGSKGGDAVRVGEVAGVADLTEDVVRVDSMEGELFDRDGEVDKKGHAV